MLVLLSPHRRFPCCSLAYLLINLRGGENFNMNIIQRYIAILAGS